MTTAYDVVRVKVIVIISMSLPSKDREKLKVRGDRTHSQSLGVGSLDFTGGPVAELHAPDAGGLGLILVRETERMCHKEISRWPQ